MEEKIIEYHQTKITDQYDKYGFKNPKQNNSKSNTTVH